MKKIFLILIAAFIGTFTMTACHDMLDTNPTGQIEKEKLYKTVEGANAAMNGVYRFLAGPGAISSNLEQAFGLGSHQLGMDLMGDDMVQREPGAYAWFSYHYAYQIRKYYTSNSFPSYEIWNQWYTVINQTNEVIAFTPASEGEKADKDAVIGQAYAMRGFAYFNLIRWYQRTYKGHESDPGVPIYTTPTTITRKGNPRSTVDSVYMQINADLDSAQFYFATASAAVNKTQVDKYVTYGFQSRVAMVQERWDVVAETALQAMGKPGMMLMDNNQLTAGFNSLDNSEWMWGAMLRDGQTTGYACLWAHMDSRLPLYGETSRKIASKWLYDQIYVSDARREWFRDPETLEKDEQGNMIEEITGTNVAYYQKKYHVANTGSLSGDYLFMRGAEMYLNRAEALCRMGQYSEARELLIKLVGPRYPVENGKNVYEILLEYVPDGNKMSGFSGDKTPIIDNLLDQIMLERRIELWGEGFRLFDILRTHSPLYRDYVGTNHARTALASFSDPETWYYILTIPQAEFDSNESLDSAKDQNPIINY